MAHYLLIVIGFDASRKSIMLLTQMVGYWHYTTVCPSVCLSVCDVVHCGAYARCSAWVESCTIVRVPRKALPIHIFRLFAVRCIVQPQHTGENRTAEIFASGIAMGSVVT